jgi:uncharacterized surface protein with fasciclin (FAS1) repeats
MRKLMVAALGGAALTLAGCGDDAPANNVAEAAQSDSNILAALGSQSDLSTATGLLKSAGLEQTLNGVGSYTLFLPVNDAFESLPEDQRTALSTEEGRPQAIALISQHISPGYVAREDMMRGLAAEGGTGQLATMGAQPLALRRQGDAVVIGTGENGPRIVGDPVMARNGIVYRIDRVIPPAG